MTRADLAAVDPAAVTAPLAGSAGKQFRPSGRDDFSDLMELMEVVEALCPIWPSRPIRTGGDFRL